MNLKDCSPSSLSAKRSSRGHNIECSKARERAHLLAGLAIAVANLDPVIR